MRTIKFTDRFKRDYKRESKGKYRKTIDADLLTVLGCLTSDQPLPSARRDHPLMGEWSDHRDCHIHPDLVLIYRKPETSTLELVRMGSHSELGI